MERALSSLEVSEKPTVCSFEPLKLRELYVTYIPQIWESSTGFGSIKQKATCVALSSGRKSQTQILYEQQ